MPATRHTVPAADAGSRIDRVLAALLDEPRARAQGRLDRGEVSLDGVVVRKSFRVAGGEQVTVAAVPTPRRSAAPPAVPVRYADDDVIVVAKPAGLVVHAGAGVHDGTLVDVLDAMGVTLAASDDPARPGIVHRLDRGTSGLLVVARTPAALAGLRPQFEAHTVERRYEALVEGVPVHVRATIDAPIARHPGDRTRFRTAADGRPAVTHYEVRASWATASRVEVRLETGRTHQVRVHLSALGHPVCGDVTYGASADLAAGLGLGRPALHAAGLAFDHPVTGVRIALDEPLPADLRGALDRLGAPAGGVHGAPGPPAAMC